MRLLIYQIKFNAVIILLLKSVFDQLKITSFLLSLKHNSIPKKHISHAISYCSFYMRIIKFRINILEQSFKDTNMYLLYLNQMFFTGNFIPKIKM